MATGNLTGDPGSGLNLIDHGWNGSKRNTLHGFKHQEDLQGQTDTLHNLKEEILSQVITRLQLILIGAGYERDRAYQLASSSMYYRISRENYEAYLNLHMHLLAQCSECGFAETKPYIMYHA